MDAGRYHSNKYNDEVIQEQFIVLINAVMTEKWLRLGVLYQGIFGKQIQGDLFGVSHFSGEIYC